MLANRSIPILSPPLRLTSTTKRWMFPIDLTVSHRFVVLPVDGFCRIPLPGNSHSRRNVSIFHLFISFDTASCSMANDCLHTAVIVNLYRTQRKFRSFYRPSLLGQKRWNPEVEAHIQDPDGSLVPKNLTTD